MQGNFSIVLVAVVDSGYKFVVMYLGAYGRLSDGGGLKQSVFGQYLEKGRLELAKNLPRPNTTLHAPFVYVGDEAFQVRPDFLRHYPGRRLDDDKCILNCRLSWAR